MHDNHICILELNSIGYINIISTVERSRLNY